jgi:hypothetical protein
MKKNRRDFFRISGLAGLGLAGNTGIRNSTKTGSDVQIKI